jgi:hypothetical protein
MINLYNLSKMSTAVPKSAGLVTIRYVVMSMLNRLQDYSMKSYLRYLQIAIEGFSEELSLYHVNAGMEVVYLRMSVAKTCQLPSDYVKWNKIGYPIGGKLKVITHNESILLPRVFDDTGDAIGNYYGAAIGASDLSNAVFFSDHYHNGAFIGGLYGLPGGIDVAGFRIDREYNQIVFSGSTPRSEIVMEYVSNGLKSDGSSLIPREVVPALRTYVLWQKDEPDPRIACNAKERLKTEHEEAVAALRSFQLSFTADEYLQMVRSGIHQAPKR